MSGLAALVEGVESVSERARAWCVENDVDEVRQIVLAGLEDAFVAALGVKAGRARETILRAKLRALRDGGANGSIIGRNTFQRPRDEALDLLGDIIDIYRGKL